MYSRPFARLSTHTVTKVAGRAPCLQRAVARRLSRSDSLIHLEDTLTSPSPHSLSLSVCHSWTHTQMHCQQWQGAVCIMILSSQIDGVLSALSVTQREERQREYKWITPPHTHKHTPDPSIMASSHRLPVSTEALINRGRALAFVSLGQRRRNMADFY